MPDPKVRQAKKASEFGEDKTSFLWYPYLPRGDYSVLMADGGTGKTILCCGIAADVSSGKHLPGRYDVVEPQNVLFISAEDRGEMLKHRLALSGADLDRCFVLDCVDSEGLNIDSGFEEFAATVMRYNPALVIVDPWHAFLGERVDISRVNAVRPVLHRLANLAKFCNCALIAVSHVNKRAQGENANHAATGSTDFINAARSALRIVFDESDKDGRIIVHTKSNYAPYGRSVRYVIQGGGLVWSGFSEIDKSTLEAAARRRTTPSEIMRRTLEDDSQQEELVQALEESVTEGQKRFTYEEFKKMHGDDIFGHSQPKRALDNVKERLSSDGYFLQTGIHIKRDGLQNNGFLLTRTN